MLMLTKHLRVHGLPQFLEYAKKHHYTHFAEEETEAQQSKVAGPGRYMIL